MNPVICMSIENDCVIVVKGYRKKNVNGFIGLDFISTCACESLKQLWGMHRKSVGLLCLQVCLKMQSNIFIPGKRQNWLRGFLQIFVLTSHVDLQKSKHNDNIPDSSIFCMESYQSISLPLSQQCYTIQQKHWSNWSETQFATLKSKCLIKFKLCFPQPFYIWYGF